MKKIIRCLFLVIGFSLPVLVHAESYQLSSLVPDISKYWDGKDPINQVAPEASTAWPETEESNFYYIDNTDKNATDNNNEFGYPNKPRKTIPEISYPKGAYIEVHGGPYFGGSQLVITAEGTSDSPVWLRGPSIDAPALIRSELIVKGQYIYMENLKFDRNKKTLGLRNHGDSYLHHAMIRNSIFIGEGTAVGAASAIAIYGSKEKRFHDILVFNNTISNFGDPSQFGEDDYVGVMPRINVDRVWIVKNHIFDVGGDSVLVGIASTNDVNRVSDIYISDNKLHSNGENAVDVKEADNVIIANNLLFDMKKSFSSAGEIIIVHDKPTNVTIINNEIHSGEYGVVVTSGENIWLIGNLIYNIHYKGASTWDSTNLYSSGAAIHFRSTGTAGIINNSIIDYDTGIQLANGTSGYTVINNLFSGKTNENAFDIISGNSTNDKKSIVQSNLFYNEKTGLLFKWNGSEIRESLFVDCLSCKFNVNPLIDFIDIDATTMELSLVLDDEREPNNEHLTSKAISYVDLSSPLIDGGFDVEQYISNIESKYLISLDKDRYETSRPYNSGTYDIGALESKKISEIDIDKPNPPSNLQISVE